MKILFNLKKNAKNIFLLTILLFIYTSICAISYAKTTSQNLADSVLRLHVLANSDSIEDQSLKLKVRDELLNYMNSICSNTTSKDEAILIASQNINIFKKIAEDTIKSNGYDYSANIEIGNYNFPTKNYGDISFPAGKYDALRVTIGEAKGQNWWCVMFPPLCFIDVTSGIVPDESKEILKNNMNEEDYALVSDSNNTEIKFKFKLLEFFGKNGFLTAKN